MKRRRACARRHTVEYAAEAGVCGKCNWREHCTTAVAGRTVQRHEQAAQVAAGKAIARSPQGQRDRWRRQTLIEGKFCASRQRTRVQAEPAAAAVAPGDPGLAHRRRAEREASGESRRKESGRSGCSDGTRRRGEGALEEDYPAWAGLAGMKSLFGAAGTTSAQQNPALCLVPHLGNRPNRCAPHAARRHLEVD